MIQFKRWDIDDRSCIDDLNEWIRENAIEVVDFKMIDEYRVLISYRLDVAYGDNGERIIVGFNPAWEKLIKGE